MTHKVKVDLIRSSIEKGQINLFPISERIAKQGFYLPSSLGLTKDNVKRVTETLLKILI